jgi:hypothetical protein
VPPFVFDHDFVFVAEGNLDALAEWALERSTWIEGRYMPFREYIKRWTPEKVAEELANYERALLSVSAEDECVCRTAACGHPASFHSGPNGQCRLCLKECWS